MLEDDGAAGDQPLRDRSAVRSPPSRAQRRREEVAWSPTAWQLLREGRWALAPSAAAGGLVVVAGVVVLLVLGLGSAGGAVDTPSPGVAVPLRGSASPTATAATSASTVTTASAPAEVVVDVTGEVARPGLVRLGAGARVDDALRAAGGPLDGADLRRLNLARVLADGEQLVVPAPGEELPEPPAAPPAALGGPAAAAGGTAAPATDGAGRSPGSASEGPVDLNSATAADLDALPGVGPVLAQRILDRRAAHGPYTSVDELAEVQGIGPTILARLAPRLRV